MNLQKAIEQIKALEADLQKKHAKVSQLKLQVLQYMHSNDMQFAEVGSTKLKLTKKKGRQNKTSSNKEELSAIRSAISAEQAEMRSVNATAIYQIESEMVMLEAKLNSYTTNEWVEDLELQLAKAIQDSKQKLNELPDEEMRLSIKTDLDLFSTLDKEDAQLLCEEGLALKQIAGKPLSKANIRQFLGVFYNGKYGALDLLAAWEKRKQEHIDYLTSN